MGPARLVDTICFGTPFPMASLAQDASQPAAHKAVFPAECRTVAVLEVFKPAPQRPVHVGDDLGHAVPRGPLGLRPDRVSELLAALVPRPALASLEVVAEKVTCFQADGTGEIGIHKSSLIRIGAAQVGAVQLGVHRISWRRSGWRR